MKGLVVKKLAAILLKKLYGTEPRTTVIATTVRGVKSNLTLIQFMPTYEKNPKA